ncbi:hypothetical protein Tco_0011742 [Tanacetum coccineum]
MKIPMNIQGKIFDPGITIHGKSFEKDVFNDKSSKELAPSKALLTLDVFDPLHPPLMDFHVSKAFFGFTFQSRKFFSKKFELHPEINILWYSSSITSFGEVFHLFDFLPPLLLTHHNDLDWKDSSEGVFPDFGTLHGSNNVDGTKRFPFNFQSMVTQSSLHKWENLLSLILTTFHFSFGKDIYDIDLHFKQLSTQPC